MNKQPISDYLSIYEEIVASLQRIEEKVDYIDSKVDRIDERTAGGGADERY
ncbi:hypothetical protein [Halobacillus naozhouensis]|uniref:DegQ (SacQ) family protein n=1 Tax=Halobacillus naozhouensis TaxID=554880 RepID=A0ABY8J1W0_9BACI|nr:hypothetical protein [Halobacillus naozhouensis]WFT74886.1 hypothetical protein P9989_00150 [Halobacillus naozhouensis]